MNSVALFMPYSIIKLFFFFITLLAACITPNCAWSSAGDLDSSFGKSGKLTTEVSVGRDVGSSVALQSDGKIVVAGWSDGAEDTYKFAIVRYNTNGTLDRNFGKQGIIITQIGTANSQAFSVMVQPDGKIIAVGTTNSKETDKDIALVRYNTDGSLDATFGMNGIVITSISVGADFVNSAALQQDGKIIVAAHFSNGKDSDVAVVRYNTDGILDAKFGSGGIVTTAIGPGDDEAYGVAVQPNGKIVVVGSSRNTRNVYNFAVVQFNADGTLDTAFGTGGKVTTVVSSLIDRLFGGDDEATGIALQPDGKIIVSGHTYKDFTLVRYTVDGRLDDTFHGNGILTIKVSRAKDEAKNVVVQPDGKIVTVGKAIGSLGADKSLGSSGMDVAVVRCNSDGTLDTTFGVGGIVTTAIGESYDVAHSAAIQPDGKLVVAGYSKLASYDFAVLRYDFGTFDTAPSSVNLNPHSNAATPTLFGSRGPLVYSALVGLVIIGWLLWTRNVLLNRRRGFPKNDNKE